MFCHTFRKDVLGTFYLKQFSNSNCVHVQDTSAQLNSLSSKYRQAPDQTLVPTESQTEAAVATILGNISSVSTVKYFLSATQISRTQKISEKLSVCIIFLMERT